MWEAICSGLQPQPWHHDIISNEQSPWNANIWCWKSQKLGSWTVRNLLHNYLIQWFMRWWQCLVVLNLEIMSYVCSICISQCLQLFTLNTNQQDPNVLLSLIHTYRNPGFLLFSMWWVLQLPFLYNRTQHTHLQKNPTWRSPYLRPSASWLQSRPLYLFVCIEGLPGIRKTFVINTIWMYHS
jgi:hypothetical protein